MATAIPLEPATIEKLDRAVSRGRFPSRDEAIRDALDIVEELDNEPLSAAELAAIDEGLAQARAGNLISLEDVRDEMKRRFAPAV